MRSKIVFLLVAMLALLSEPRAATTASVTLGPWLLYQGTSIVQPRVENPTLEACAEQAKALGVARTYTCRSIADVAVDVAVDAPACPAQPAEETQTVACPAGTVGSWTQTRTYGSVPAPTCWEPGLWAPAAPPAGACTEPTPAASEVRVSFTPIPYTASVLPNPDKGVAYTPTGGVDMMTGFNAGTVASGIAQGYRMFICPVSLAAYRTSAIPQSFLDKLQTILNTIRAAGGKCMGWFFYDFSSGGNDAKADQIVAHLQQLGPLLKANADVLPYMKGGFIGAWGEWHSSANCNSFRIGTTASGCTAATALANQQKVRDALLANTDPATFVGIRYPVDIARWYPTPTDATTAYTTPQGRLAYQNDCPISSDANTWVQPSYATLNATQQKAYADSMTDWTASFGEVSTSCSGYKAACAVALEEFKARNATSLKIIPGRDSDAITSTWAAEGCKTELFNRIGYFIQLGSLRHADQVQRGAAVNFTVEALNAGFSRVHQARPLQIVLTSGASSIACEAPAALRSLPPMATAFTELPVSCSIPADAEPGDYEVGIRMPDVWTSTKGLPAFAIRPANVGAWDASTATFKTGSVLKVR